MPLSVWTDTQVINQLDSGQHWFGRTITYAFPEVSIFFTAESGERTGFVPLTASQKSVVQLALATWNDLISPSIVFTSSYNANIEYGYSTTGVDYAHAYFPNDGSVWFNSDAESLALPELGSYGFYVYVHETGHALGLEHMGDYNGEGIWSPSCYQDSTLYSIMSYFGPNMRDGEGLVAWADWTGADNGDYSPQTPMMNDVLAMQQMYGALGVRSGNSVYGFGSDITGSSSSIYDFTVNHNPIICIYDAGGEDTLNLTGWSTSSEISLLAGSFSSCNSMTNNISIARGVLIENACTGAGDDYLIGNDINNYLASGDGNDTLVAAAGNDTVDGGLGTDTLILNGSRVHFSAEYEVGTGIYSLTDTSGSLGFKLVSGVEQVVFDDQSLQLDLLVPEVFRFYNATTGAHFYTASKIEADYVKKTLSVFDYEGPAFNKSVDVASDSINIFRFYNSATETHFYTGSEVERDAVIARFPTFHYEGVAYQAHGTEAAGTTELYRFYNFQTGTHFYTASQAEMESVRANLSGVFNFEGVAFFVDAL